ncbi:YybH family protein [Marilutibacter chinensis]|uniref:Nuclear transport factor 2 family protein n=1 Tax=Marilutibacter chinensis TaxID=2912247 RepID=A0ABS9HUK4_9GAMM|nr:nuclear transport factor 2 family protein [Lysobacter chinensis]MCF7222338.1 nuclear transport factor 2 family protein [Lysobacter chinensis]
MRTGWLLAALLVVPLHANADGETTAEREIKTVIEHFETAIIDKDKEKFLSLFLHPNVTWQPVLSQERYTGLLQSDPDTSKAGYDPSETPERFIAGISASKSRIEETFENVVIDTDGEAASVAFDFKFLRDGTALNVGREYWLMVRTEDGWKITAVIWSRNTPPRP